MDGLQPLALGEAPRLGQHVAADDVAREQGVAGRVKDAPPLAAGALAHRVALLGGGQQVGMPIHLQAVEMVDQARVAQHEGQQEHQQS